MKLSQEKGEKFHSFHVATHGDESRSQRLSVTDVKYHLFLWKGMRSSPTADFSSVLRLCLCSVLCALCLARSLSGDIQEQGGEGEGGPVGPGGTEFEFK